MMKPVFLTLFTVLLTALRTVAPDFEGRIIYQYSFTDLKGNDITAKLTPYFGEQQRYFIKGEAYKAYNEKDQWVQLYEGATNQYHYFADGKLVKTFAAGDEVSPAKVTALKGTEKVLERTCQSVQIEADGITTVYFYSPEVRVDPALFAKHNFGHWNTFMQVSKGSLPLMFSSTNPKAGYIMKAVAVEVTPMQLKREDFTLLAAGQK